jgi:hypothetical protein
MCKIRFRVWLPFVFGVLSIALMTLALYVGRRCVFYDAGRPFWPCEAPEFALKLLNAPPIVVALPLANSWRTAPSYFAYVVELPFVILWWWFVGTRLDFGLLGVGAYRHRRAWLVGFMACLVLLLAFMGWSVWESVRASPFTADALLTSISVLQLLLWCLWLLILIFAFGVAAFRLARGQTGQSDKNLASSRTLRLCALGLGLYCLCTAMTVWHSKLVERQRQDEYDLHRITIKGRVLDDQGSPVYAIKVDLIPILDGGAVPEEEAAYDFTNKDGEYILSPEQAGRYMLSVQWNAPPSTKHPFLTRYYRDATDSNQAETLEITPARHMTMNPIQLQRLGTVRVPVSVSWSDGKPESNASFLFMNIQYPQFGVIGSESLLPDSDGTVSLPIGFDYQGTAQVNCDDGPKIKSVEAPRLTFSLKLAGAQTKPLRFILPGNPCRIWHPQ